MKSILELMKKKLIKGEAKRIEKLLRKALLHEGKMVYGLYEYELEKHLDYWHKGLLEDNDECVFVVTENTEHVAMVLIMPDKTIYINEEAREKLKAEWRSSYVYNVETLLAVMADSLANGNFWVCGHKTAADDFSMSF